MALFFLLEDQMPGTVDCSILRSIGGNPYPGLRAFEALALVRRQRGSAVEMSTLTAILQQADCDGDRGLKELHFLSDSGQHPDLFDVRQ